jgi:hypothetical protein
MFKDKKYIVIGIITLVLVIGLSVIGVKAANRLASVTINNVENLTMNVEGSADDINGVLGASGTRFPHGISADSTSPSAGEVRGTTFTSTGAATIGGAFGVTGETDMAGLTSGNGTLASTTSASAGTLTEADLLANSVLDVLSTVSTSFALTLPATSTMTTLLPNAGDMRSWWIQNASSTAAVAMTITKGAGVDLIGVDTDVDVIDGAEWSVLNCYRKVDTDVVCELSELVHAD